MADTESVAEIVSRRADADRAALTDILLRTGAGDRDAFELLYKKTSAKLFGVCLRIFGERADAEEALQEAYLTIWKKASAFQAARASPISWLVAVTRNRAIDRLRSGGRATFASLEAAAEVPDPGQTAEEVLIGAADDGALTQCLAELEPRDAQFIRAAFLGGATYVELAQQEGSPLGTVKTRIRRALARLRGCLNAQS